GAWLVVRFPAGRRVVYPKEGYAYHPGESLGEGIVVGQVSGSRWRDPRALPGRTYRYLLVPVDWASGQPHYKLDRSRMVSVHTPELFPGVVGQPLLDSLVAHFKPAHVLPYSQARDTLFARIYLENDSLRGVYSGYTIWLDPNQDPTTFAFQHHINTEHTWPQSKGAGSGNPRSDMHHLFPVRDNVNSARGNLPFAEIDDAETDRWYRRSQVLQSIPSQFIDEYSEKDNDQPRFEPREDHKGNAARAMFYFYTMYRAEADAADPTFFPLQKAVLRRWHSLDPVDSLELVRTFKIATYQDGKPNPFVVDTTLVRRAYFPELYGSSVALLSFSGVYVGPEIQLDWETASEKRVEGFRVFRRREDSGRFVLLADYLSDPALLAMGGPQQGAHYTLVDSTPVANHAYVYRLVAQGLDGDSLFLGDLSVVAGQPTGIESASSPEPARFQLAPAYPNPFNGQLVVPVEVETSGAAVALTVLDVLGRRVRHLFSGRLSPGRHLFRWNAADGNGRAVPSGIYFIRLQSGPRVQVRKVILIR
ncbi:MAG: T9SS C-terminal target domain-containing protein, partial [Calditrichaeota bacterium]